MLVAVNNVLTAISQVSIRLIVEVRLKELCRVMCARFTWLLLKNCPRRIIDSVYLAAKPIATINKIYEVRGFDTNILFKKQMNFTVYKL